MTALLAITSTLSIAAAALGQDVYAPPPRTPSRSSFLCSADGLTGSASLSQVTVFSAADYSDRVRVSFAKGEPTYFENVRSIMHGDRGGRIFSGEKRDGSRNSTFSLTLIEPLTVAMEAQLAFRGLAGSFAAKCVKA